MWVMASITVSTNTLKDDEVRNRARSLYLQDKSIKSIQEELGVNEKQWEASYYLDIQGFRSFWLEVKKEKMLKDAEAVSNKILKMKDVENNAKMLAIQQKEAEFIRETQGKDMGYSKRIETIGLNINKTEPLDDDQKEKLNKLLKKAGNEVPDNVDVVNKSSNIDTNL